MNNRLLVALSVLALALVATTGCHTVEGFGKDVEKAGEKVGSSSTKVGEKIQEVGEKIQEKAKQ